MHGQNRFQTTILVEFPKLNLENLCQCAIQIIKCYTDSKFDSGILERIK